MKQVFTLFLLSLSLIPNLLSANCANGQLTLVVNLDNNPTEVNWEIKNTANAIVAWSGGATYSATDANQTISESIATLPDGDYSIVVYDAGGNGLCCANGNGSWELKDGSNTIIAQGAIYEYSSLKTFCVNTSTNFVFDLIAPTASILSASNVTATTVDLSWTAATDNVGVVTYGVFYNDVYFGDLNATNVTAPIPNGVTNIYVVSRDEIGNFSARSNSVTVMPTNGVTTTVFSQSYFENGWDDWFDGGSDCFRYNGTNFSSEGQFSIRLRDNSGRRSSMTSKSFDFTAYDSVRIQFAYYHRNYETGEDFFIKLRENGNFNTVARFSKPADFNANGFYSVNVLLKAQDYSFESNSKLRIQSDASNNNDQIYIDQVIVTGYSSAASSNLRKHSVHGKSLFTGNKELAVRSDNEKRVKEQLTRPLLKIYPNPTNDIVYIENIDLKEIENIEVFNTDGKRLSMHHGKRNYIALGNYPPGLYIVKVNLENGTSLSERCLKK